MIKKSVFEEELISGMQKELRAQASEQNADHLDKAVDYLHSAMEIFEEAGMQSKANALFSILTKIAENPIAKKTRPVKQMPVMHLLMKAGLTQKDITDFAKGSPIAKAKVNHILRNLGHTDQEIGEFIGHHNVMPADVARDLIAPPSSGFSGLGKIDEWISDPKAKGPGDVVPGDLIAGKSLLHEPGAAIPAEKEFGIKSLLKSDAQSADEAEARKHKEHSHKFQTPSTSKINDPHIKNLTPEKMIENLKHHGTVFNMKDEGAPTHKAPSKVKNHTHKADDDLLDAEVTDELEVSDADSNLEMDFEDEI